MHSVLLPPYMQLHQKQKKEELFIFAIQWMVKQNASNASGPALLWHWKNLGFTSQLKEAVHTKVTFHKGWHNNSNDITA